MKIEKAKSQYCFAIVPLTGENTHKLSRFPGFKKWVGRKMMFAPTGADNEARPFLDSYISTLKAADDKSKFCVPENDDFMFETEPFDHQRKAFYMSRNKKNFALLMEQGTGKSKVEIDNAAYLYANNKITTFVIIAPNGVHRNWLNNEIPIHLPEWCPRRAIFYSAGMKKSQKDEWGKIFKSNSAKIYQFNYA